jgi:hypothetical protein
VYDSFTVGTFISSLFHTQHKRKASSVTHTECTPEVHLHKTRATDVTFRFFLLLLVLLGVCSFVVAVVVVVVVVVL